MKNRYLTDTARPDYDEGITIWLSENESEIDSMPYKIALMHNDELYRSITCSGLGEYVSAFNFLGSKDLVNLLKPDATFRGYDAVFVTREVYKKVSQAR